MQPGHAYTGPFPAKRTVTSPLSISGAGSRRCARPSVAKGEDVVDLALERLARDLRRFRTARAHHDPVFAADELEHVDLAALVERPAEGVDHLVAAVADEVVAQSSPGDVGSEQR
jgi:hypothetical protein